MKIVWVRIGLVALIATTFSGLEGCKRPAALSSLAGRSQSTSSNLSPSDQALETKIEPVIECLNRTLSHFHDMAPQYEERVREISGAKPPVSATGMPIIPTFSTFVSFKVEPYEQGGEFSRKCADGLEKAASLPPANAAIDGPGKDAAAALRALLVPGGQMDSYLDQKAYQDDGGAKGRELDATITPLLKRIVSDTRQMRGAVFDVKGSLVQDELTAMEKKSGRDLNWHTKQTMQAASVADHQVQAAAESGQISAAGVTQAMAPLQAALNDTQAYLAAHADATRDVPGQVSPVWPAIEGSLNAQVAQMRDLRDSLSGPNANRSSVDDHLQAVNNSFNGAVQNYNQQRGFVPLPR